MKAVPGPITRSWRWSIEQSRAPIASRIVRTSRFLDPHHLVSQLKLWSVNAGKAPLLQSENSRLKALSDSGYLAFTEPY